MIFALFPNASLLEQIGTWIMAASGVVGAVFGVWKKFGSWRWAAAKTFFCRVTNTCDLVEKELKTNGGGSLKDAISRVEYHTAGLSGKFQATMSHVSTPMWESDKDGNLTYANRAYVRLFGRDTHELQGMGWLTDVADSDRRQVEDDWNNAVENQRIFDRQFLIVTGDNRTIRVCAEAIPVFVPGRGAVGHIGALQLLGDHT